MSDNDRFEAGRPEGTQRCVSPFDLWKKRRGLIVRLLMIFVLPLATVLLVPVIAGETWTMFTYVFLYVLLVVFMALNDLRWFVVPAMRDRRARSRQKAS